MFKKIGSWFRKPITTLLLCIVLVGTATAALLAQGSLIGGNETGCVTSLTPLSDVPILTEETTANAGDS